MIGAQVQKAIRDALVGANVCGGRVYDRVPQDPTFPYATIGDEILQDRSTSCNAAWDVLTDVHVWSRPGTASKAEVKAAAASVHDAVMAMTAVTGFHLSRVDYEGGTVRREADGLTEHSISVFRVCVDPLI